MAYIGQDGSVGGRKPFTRAIVEFFEGIINFISLFFGSITNPPRIESRSTYGHRNGVTSRSGGSGRPLGGSNVRGIRDLGDAQARMGG